MNRSGALAAAAGFACVTLAGTVAPAAAVGHLAPVPPTRAASPVPAGFKAQSITWTSPRRGWVLGAVPCGTSACTEMIATLDGSAWAGLGRVPAPIARSGLPGVSEIRMASPRDGWVFGPGLFHTADGGRRWRAEPIPGGGKQVLSLAATPTMAYAIVSPCATGSVCHRRLSVGRTHAPARPSWRRLRLTLPPNTSFGEFPATVAISGRTVYLADAQQYPAPDAFYASVGAGPFVPRPVPCAKAQDGSLADIAPYSPARVVLLCVINPGMGSALKTVYRSADTGRTDHPAGRTPLFGLTGLIAATPGGTLAVASSGARGSFVYLNTGGTRWTTPLPKPNDGGAGWNDLTFSSATTGWVVYGPDDFSSLGVVYRTGDGGRTWRPYTFSRQSGG